MLGGALRPKPVPAAPIHGSDRSLKVPLAVMSPLCLFGRLTQVGLRTDVRILEQVLRTKLIAQLGQRMNLHDQRWVLVPLRVAHLALSFYLVPEWMVVL